MKLYYIVGSPNSRKVHAVANHLGLRLDFEYLDLFAGENRRPEYLAINPNGMVPALVDGDLTLWESNAIMQYLADGTPGNTLLPQDRRTRGEINRWQSWELAHYNKALGTLAFETFAKALLVSAPADPRVVEQAQRELTRFAPVLEAALDGRRYLVGNTMTLADYSVGHLEMFQDMVPFDWKPYPNVSAYYARMRDLEHWAATAPNSPEALGRRPK